MANKKPILCLDFDGVCHAYTSKWERADVIPDDAVPGLFEFLEEAQKFFDIQIFSTRSHQQGGVEAMGQWFIQQEKLWWKARPAREILFAISFPKTKPPAMVAIDDRSILFTGTWPSVEMLKTFKPWNKRKDV